LLETIIVSSMLNKMCTKKVTKHCLLIVFKYCLFIGTNIQSNLDLRTPLYTYFWFTYFFFTVLL
jgi:hypothetical protein